MRKLSSSIDSMYLRAMFKVCPISIRQMLFRLKNFLMINDKNSYSRHMAESGLLECENKLPSRVASFIAKVMISRNYLAELKENMLKSILLMCNLDFRNRLSTL